MYHHINSVADEKRLLEQKLALQSTIRAKRERQRRKRTHDTEVYSQMLEPVTKSIAKLTNPITVNPSASPAVAEQESIKKEEADESEHPNQSEEEEQSEPITIKEEEPDDLYQEALAMVPRKLREDGQLGLCPSTHHIGVYAYTVYGNTLQVVSNKNEENEEMHQFDITDLNLWKLLLVLNPTKIGLKLTTTTQESKKKEYLPFVLDYVHIARKLNLLGSYRGSKNRVKYTLLTQQHWGSGFLFTSVPPTPKVVVLPPDNRGLMSELYRAVAELHAGNTTMRNLIVPMIQEARRRHIRIPPDLLDNPEDDTWVLA